MHTLHRLKERVRLWFLRLTNCRYGYHWPSWSGKTREPLICDWCGAKTRMDDGELVEVNGKLVWEKP